MAQVVKRRHHCSAEGTGDVGSMPSSGKSPGGGNGTPLQYSGLENPTDTGAWRAAAHEVGKSQTQLERLSTTGPSLLLIDG